MLRHERIDTDPSGNSTIRTSVAMGRSQVVDVDECVRTRRTLAAVRDVRRPAPAPRVPG